MQCLREEQKEMTFKRDFKEQMVHEWAENNMDYEGLKGILEEIKSSKQSHQHNQKKPRDKSLHHKLSLERAFYGLHLQQSNHGRIEGDFEDRQVTDVKKLQQDGSSPGKLYETHFLKRHEEGGEAEAWFFQKLDEELNKVNSFYKDQVEALEHEEDLLNKQMEALIVLQAKVKNPDIEMQNLSSSPAEKMDHDHQQKDMDVTNGKTNHGDEGRSNYNRRDPLEILDQVKIDNTVESSTSAIRSVFTDFKKEESSFSKEDLRKVEKQLRLVFVEFYQKLLHLKNYSFMNLSAFSKIMEKYEKTTTRAAFKAFIRVVDNSYIGTSDELEMNQKTQSYKKVTEIVPLSLLILVLLITFCPLDIIFRSSWFFFIKCLFHSLCAPFYQVRLLDFFLADQITSQVLYIYAHMVFIYWFKSSKILSFTSAIMALENTQGGKKNAKVVVSITRSFIIGVILFWFRL